MKNRTILNSKTIFIISIIVIVLTIICVWIIGIRNHHSLLKNSFVSTEIISLAFFLFICIGLYRGAKLKDNIGKVTDKFDSGKLKENRFSGLEGLETPIIGEGIESILLSILLWILVAFFFGTVLWFFGTFLWFSILAFIAMLYWIFFRALRLVFKKSPVCKNNLPKSILYAFTFTLLYNFWIFGILFGLNYFGK